MASSYNTRSTTATSASSITIAPTGPTPSSQGTTTTTTNVTVQSRHFCVALTNNPRMLRKAQQELSFLAATTTSAAATIILVDEQATSLPPQTRQRTASDSQQRGLLPPLPFNPQQPQQMRLQSRVRPFGFRQQRAVPVEQQVVPASTQPASIEPTTSIERRTYEQNIEEDLKIQIQPLLQNYLNKTQRLPPVNLFLDMSALIKY